MSVGLLLAGCSPVKTASGLPHDGVHRIVEAALMPDPTRLIRATLDDRRDATVEFTLRDLGTPSANRAAAQADARALFDALFHAPGLATLMSVTLLGVSPMPARSGADGLLLYAFLPADAALRLDWSTLSPETLERIAMVRWMPDAMCRAWNACPEAATGDPAQAMRTGLPAMVGIRDYVRVAVLSGHLTGP